MKKNIFLILCWLMAFTGCKIKTINDNKPPKDGVVKKEIEFINKEKLDAEEHYRNGQLVYTKAWYKNGKTAVERFLKSNERSNDSTLVFYRNGQLRTIMTRHGENSGIYKEYFEDGALKSTSDSLVSVEYYHRGGKKSLTHFKRGEVYNVTKWHPNGLQKETTEWKDDKRNGKWLEWDSTGKLIRNEFYSNNVKIKQ